jgi:membrane-associated protein
MVHVIVEALRAIPPPFAVAAVFLLVAAETALFLGFLIPGGLAVVLGGALAAASDVPLAGILAAGILGSIAGDSRGYFIGRRYGRQFFRRHPKKRWANARRFLRRHGESAVFVGRFTAFLRSIIPAAAGVARIEYQKFLRWSIAAGIRWGAASALLGYWAGSNLETLAHWAGWVGLILLALVAAAVAASFRYGRSRRRPRKSGRR